MKMELDKKLDTESGSMYWPPILATLPLAVR